jgi:hypothetical protein
MKKPVVHLHKYFKRMIALMGDRDRKNAFKNLMVEATHAEKNHKENARKVKEKGSSD